ncbi:acetyl-CoA carboxylase biotin carboxyl carrier protein [Alkalicoccobacillus plakortidis]|uniref:Biotin carboxyl carrier protein of acetyl-CoA carboxylase n=1 Tax=Alkalicoccobacillus plakortidis TaxID=444060 RepID=A0ABT0XGF9_9BACI|nr:acetyl-CoA carboxylase biotin carboxyl carrier protein [Alkalicoccobacillus plakortidis]MCM2674974.1 acetyl-CoA carboxylase biotin carboxyl carrier protein [Alkalicoccobacillus plakortidis]
MNVQDIKDLIQAVNQSDIDELEYEQEGNKLVLKKVKATAVVQAESYQPIRQSEVQQTSATPASAPPVAEDKQAEPEINQNLHTVKSPMVGTFYSSPSPDDAAYVSIGDQVKEDSIVCIVEAMKLMNEIEADVNGKIVEVVAQNGELVEYGQPLFVVELK